jgi:segregation and condensation protein B
LIFLQVAIIKPFAHLHIRKFAHSFMDISNLIPHIEALIFASDKPLNSTEITELINQAFGFMEDKIEPGQVDAALEGIVEKYNSEFYPFEVRTSGGGWQFLTKKDFHKTVAQLNGEKFLKRLSAAALETLAIIAYKQPITKGEIEAIRGVSSDYSVQKLLEKELIVISGRNEKLPGHPLIYATSKSFMDYFGINSPEELPKIKEVLADQIVEATLIRHEDFETSGLVVTDEGELIADDVETDPAEESESFLNGHSLEGEGGGEEIPGPEQSADAGSDETETSEEASNEEADSADDLTEDDFPEEEQKEIEIDENSDEIIFTSDELDESTQPGNPSSEEDESEEGSDDTKKSTDNE